MICRRNFIQQARWPMTIPHPLTSYHNLLHALKYRTISVAAEHPWTGISWKHSAMVCETWYINFRCLLCHSVQCDETHILGCNVQGTLELVREKEDVIQICRLHCISISARTACLRDLVEFWWIRKNERCGSYLHLLQIRVDVWSNTKPWARIKENWR